MLALSRRVLVRRFFFLPALLWAAAAVGYVAAVERTESAFARWIDSQNETGIWLAWGLTGDDPVHVTQRLDTDGYSSVLRAEIMPIDPDERWEIVLYVGAGPSLFTRAAIARITARGIEPEDPRHERAVASLMAAYGDSSFVRDYPSLARRAAGSPGARVQGHRLWPVMFLWIAGWYAGWALLIAAGIAALIPRRRELTDYRRAEHQCIRCRYDLGGHASATCPECGTPQA